MLIRTFCWQKRERVQQLLHWTTSRRADEYGTQDPILKPSLDAPTHQWDHNGWRDLVGPRRSHTA